MNLGRISLLFLLLSFFSVEDCAAVDDADDSQVKGRVCLAQPERPSLYYRRRGQHIVVMVPSSNG